MTELHRVTAELGEVGRLNERLGELWCERELPPEHEFHATLALEELLSNAIRHSGATDLAVRFTFEPSAFEFEVTDNGREFNPLTLPPLDAASPLEARRSGGMGVHLVRQFADELRYEYRDGRNSLVFRKQW